MNNDRFSVQQDESGEWLLIDGNFPELTRKFDTVDEATIKAALIIISDEQDVLIAGFQEQHRDLYSLYPHLEALEAIIWIAKNKPTEFFNTLEIWRSFAVKSGHVQMENRVDVDI